MASSLIGDGNNNDDGKTTLDSSIRTILSSFSSSSSSSSSSSVKTWDEIRSKLYNQQTPSEQSFRTNLAKGYGKPSPLHTTRLYNPTKQQQDEDNEDTTTTIRVTLYRDSASWCPYCQKVWIFLEEKQIPYYIEKINMRCYGNKPDSFLQLQPNGNIPVAKIDDVIYNQSNDIIYALEQLFPNTKPMLPKKEENNYDEMRMKAQKLLRLERLLFSSWLSWLTSTNFDSQHRQRNEFEAVLQQVENELIQSNQMSNTSTNTNNNNESGKRGGFFFLGDSVSLVDIMFIPFLERMVASLLYYKGFMIRTSSSSSSSSSSKYPAINQWFDSMEQLESYQFTKSDYYTHCWDLPPQLGGCSEEDDGLIYRHVINGERRLNTNNDNNDDDKSSLLLGSWELPLERDNGGVEPDWTWCYDDILSELTSTTTTTTTTDKSIFFDEASKREAVERLSYNHENVIKFASRAATTTTTKNNNRFFGAPLSDPNAIPNESILPLIDIVLRLICQKMLCCSSSSSSSEEPEEEEEEQYSILMNTLANSIISSSSLSSSTDNDDSTPTMILLQYLIDSLAYLRDRIGVPRDMKYPAAKQLRAHLNWSIGILLNHHSSNEMK